MKLRPLLAVVLLAPAVALGAQAGTTKTAAKAGAKPASTAKPAASSTSATPMTGLEVGGFIGYETDDLSGLSLRLDGELPFRDLTPELKLSLVGSFGYSHLTWDPLPDVKFTADVFKLIPAARFTLPVAPQLSVFGDAGLGLAYIRAKVEFPSSPFFPGSVSDSSINLMMRLGVGAFYQVNPQLRLGAMLEFDPVFGDYGYAGNGVGGTQSTFLVQVGAMFKL